MDNNENSLMIIEENDVENEEKKETTEIDPAMKLKLAMRNKKLKDDFLNGEKTPEILNDDFDNQIEKSITEMEESIGEHYASGSESSVTSDSEDLEEDLTKNYRGVGQSVLQKRLQDHFLLPFYERRRLSQCKEESESDEEAGGSSNKPKIIITPTTNDGEIKEVSKNRFIVTKTKEVDENEKQPISILKKTPSPPSNQRNLLNNSPKKIRYEAEGLRNISSDKNSNTIHFPCSAGVSQRTNAKNLFTEIFNPHLDRRYFDSSLVEVRMSQQSLTNSSKSLDDRGICNNNNNEDVVNDIWVKRPDYKPPQMKPEKKVNLSSESVRGSLKSVSVSHSCKFIINHSCLPLLLVTSLNLKLTKNFNFFRMEQMAHQHHQYVHRVLLQINSTKSRKRRLNRWKKSDKKLKRMLLNIVRKKQNDKKRKLQN
jgi:hypothetical protein